MELAQIAKIRKLPNILVRKDRDVQRFKEGQELEVILKDASLAGGPLNMAGFCSNAGELSMLNLPSLNTEAPPLSGSGSIGLHAMNGLH